MANDNGNTPTEDIIEKCKVDLCKEKMSTKSEMDAKCTDYDTKKDIEQRYEICCLMKAEETNKFYRRINYCVGIKSAKEATLIQDKIKAMGDLYGEINKQFKDLVGKIHDTKKKMETTVEAAEKLDRCIDEEERCNPGLYQALQDGVPDIWNIINTEIKHENRHLL